MVCLTSSIGGWQEIDGGSSSEPLDGGLSAGVGRGGNEEGMLERALMVTLKKWLSANDMVIHLKDKSSMFYAAQVPAIRIDEYLDRIFRYTLTSRACYVAAMVYVQRIAKTNTNLRLNSLNAHRLIITAVVLAVKFNEDRFYMNSFYAQVGGVSLEEFNQLELEFLSCVDFHLLVTRNEFVECEKMLLKNLEEDSDGDVKLGEIKQMQLLAMRNEELALKNS